MPKQLTQYRVFIGSPGGLEAERRCFQDKLRRFTALNAEHRSVHFHPVGWEDTLGGVGRPQALINEDLKQCDYAVFVLHDRWGSAPGSEYSSGTGEEFALAEALYEQKKIWQIALYFKEVDARQLRDPGKQLEAVLAFRKRIEDGKRYLFRSYDTADSFADSLEAHLARWLLDHEGRTGGHSAVGLATGAEAGEVARGRTDSVVSPNFAFWITEAGRLLNAGTLDHDGALFCAVRATDAAASDVERAEATNLQAVSQFHLGRLDDAFDLFTNIAQRFSGSIELERRTWHARALVNKGVTLGALGRGEEEIAIYDDLLGSFGTASEPALRVQVARALFNKGVTLGGLGRGEEAIAVYDDLLGRFGTASEPALRERVAQALFNKGVTLATLGRGDEEIAIYDDLLGRFGTASESALREQVARALFNKGVALGGLGRDEEEIAVYDDLLGRFGTAGEPALREQVADALFNKGFRLGALGRGEEAIAVYDDLLGRSGTASEPVVQGVVGKARALKDAERQRRPKG